MTTITITVGSELPDLTFHWQDSAGNTIDFSSGFSWVLRVGHAGAGVLEKSSGITGSATNPNVTVTFSVNEWDNVAPGIYEATLTPRRTSDSKDREPLRFGVRVLPAIPAPVP